MGPPQWAVAPFDHAPRVTLRLAPWVDLVS
jgi:hypothetical protein